MDLFPAIDLRQGKVVRLLQGELHRQTVYADDPGAIAEKFQAEGATWLHVVNLDGAFADTSGHANQKALTHLLKHCGTMRVQIGGGLRSLGDMEMLLNLGAARVIIGSKAVDDPTLVQDAVKTFGAERIIVGIDARGGVENGEVKTKGWTEGGGLSPLTLAHRMTALGVVRFIYTDIGRDGMQTGPDSQGSALLAHKTETEVIISGGVGGAEHLKEAVALVKSAHPGRLGGVIAGKALYEGTLAIPDALKTLDAHKIQQ